MGAGRITGGMIATSTSFPPPTDHARIVIRPLSDRRQRLDVTDVVAGAIATHLSRMFGGNDVLNELEAERVLQEALFELRQIRPVL